MATWSKRDLEKQNRIHLLEAQERVLLQERKDWEKDYNYRLRLVESAITEIEETMSQKAQEVIGDGRELSKNPFLWPGLTQEDVLKLMEGHASKIERVNALRALIPGIGIRAAKQIVEDAVLRAWINEREARRYDG